MKTICSECGRDWIDNPEKDGYTICCGSAWGVPRLQIEVDDVVINKSIGQKLMWEIYESFGTADSPVAWTKLMKMLGKDLE